MKQGDRRGRCPQAPRIFEACAPVSEGAKKRPLTAWAARGQMHRRRTIDLNIPHQVASPQSLTLFLQVRKPSIESHRRPQTTDDRHHGLAQLQ